MITLHHLNKSRSKRIIWLLEELDVEYQIVPYQRDPVNNLAPLELKKIHSLGKSPVIEVDGKVMAESGAITEYLCQKFRPDMIPDRDSDSYLEYLQWMHFAESSAMLPLLLKLFISRDGAKMNMLNEYSQVELVKVMTYFNSKAGPNFLLDGKLTGADIMMSFVADGLAVMGALAMFPNVEKYAEFLNGQAGLQRAAAKEAELDTCVD